jgi:hypothetical protein
VTLVASDGDVDGALAVAKRDGSVGQFCLEAAGHDLGSVERGEEGADFFAVGEDAVGADAHGLSPCETVNYTNDLDPD